MGADTQTSESERLPQPLREEIELSSVLHALSDPIRLEIVRGLDECGGERACGAFGVPVTKSTLTHHFRVLREAGVIEQRREGTCRMSRIRSEDLRARFPGLLDAVFTSLR